MIKRQLVYFLYPVIFLFVFTFSTCNTGNNEKVTRKNAKNISPKYKNDVFIEFAKGFTVEKKQHYTVINVPYAWQGGKKGFTYLLVKKGDVKPEASDTSMVIEVPITRIVCTSTTHLPLLEYLGEADKLVGFPSTQYVSSKKIREMIDTGTVVELGSSSGLNLERLIELSPDAVMDFARGNQSDRYNQVQKLGIPVLMTAAYLEETPLGRAEWIKFAGLFLGKEKEADSVFRSIKNKYDSLKNLASEVSYKPKTFSGIMYGDIWYLPGGQNSGARFLSDAGGTYMWGSDSTRGSIQLSFEAVFEKARQADLWIGAGSFNTLAEMKNTDLRYASFTAFEKGNVFNYNARVNESGGNALLELGYLRPDIILADLIKILHPEFLPDHELYFYKQLK